MRASSNEDSPNAIANAVLAVKAVDAGDTAAALEHISTAQLQSRTTARRRRQVVEIAALIVAGDRRPRYGARADPHVGVSRRS